ncbi:MAG: acyl carrier protein [Epulopiscium sp. Nele67-Bin001]|nr:MAG: acyl carrier protein [Epulopiscium sp. Nuni2H_MBin001]OON93386.1 MAG: acyl carrier protein [Epulopiscium sp. Nele67-Bin001]
MIINTVKFIISNHLHASEYKIHADTQFLKDLNADSLDILEVVMAVEAEFNIEIDSRDIGKIKTVGDLCKCISALTGLV